MSVYSKIELPENNLSEDKKESWILFYKNKISEDLPIWQNDIYQFLLDWLNNETWIYSFTSGSTGEPKRIKLEKSAMIFSAENTNENLKLVKGNKFLLCLPAKFIGGKMFLVRAILCQAELWITEPKTQLMDEDLTFDFSALIPVQASNYLHFSQLKIRKIIIGGATIPSELEMKIRLVKDTVFWSTYGMTETVSHIALRELNGENISSYYTPFKNILIGEDERGCVTIYNRKLANEVIVTNDLVEFDQHHNFRILGRIDHIINSGGLKIIPELMEKEIEVMAKKRVLVFGMPDEKWGERVCVLLEGEELDAVTIKLLLSHFKEQFGNKAPVEVFFMNQFIDTENNKINRKKTLSLFKESI